MKPKIIVIVGLTASGKTSLGVDLARQWSGEIISVDSRQIYQGMDIGTAKAGNDIRKDIPHHGLDLFEPDHEVSVAEFKEYAEAKIAEIVGRGKLPILIGGTGLWIQAIVDNFEIPSVPPDLLLRAELKKLPLSELFARYEKLDPVGALVIDQNNQRRLIRAVEVCEKSGRPFSKMKATGEAKYDALIIGINVPRCELNQRINIRVDEMITAGFVDEVKRLYDRFGGNAFAMTGIGYRQICGYLENQATLEEEIEQIKNDTRHYAKRQMTWFKRDKRIKWIKDIESARRLAKEFLKNNASR